GRALRALPPRRPTVRPHAGGTRHGRGAGAGGGREAPARPHRRAERALRAGCRRPAREAARRAPAPRSRRRRRVTLRIGTRRSPLALAQAEEVRVRLAEHGVDSEIVPMSTSGDEGAPSGDAPAGLKGLFVDTILDALERDEIDVAVHSAKDLPAESDDGLVIAAVPLRVDPADVLVLRDATLRSGAEIGTSSIRRRAQLLRAFPGVTVSDLRGNVDTRLRKVAEGVVDAAVLALAGLTRLGITPNHSAP